MTETLVERPLYPSAPSQDLVKQFRKHVDETGSPETFPSISTTRPPADGEIKALWHPVDINAARRESRDMAPCPICSPTAPKYLYGGTLIWCSDTQAIYAVGPACSHTLWKDGRLDRAVNVLRQSETEAFNIAQMVEGLDDIPRLIAWISAHRAQADKVERLHEDFAREAPSLRATLSRSLKTSTGGIVIVGAGFLQARWRLDDDLDTVKEWLEGLAAETKVADVAGLAPAVVSARLVRFRAATAKLLAIWRRMDETAQFLSVANIRALSQWARSDAAPRGFRASSTLTTIFISGMDEQWSGSVGTAAPPKPLER